MVCLRDLTVPVAQRSAQWLRTRGGLVRQARKCVSSMGIAGSTWRARLTSAQDMLRAHLEE
eukprot:6530844-Alexandrium_andersonii.AAC.1